MSIDPRLAAKLDQALVACKATKSVNGQSRQRFVADLVARCQTRAAFAITLDGVTHQVSPASIRVSKTVIDLGPVRIRLGCVQLDWDETEDDGPVATFYSFHTADQDDDWEAAPHRLTFDQPLAMAA